MEVTKEKALDFAEERSRDLKIGLILSVFLFSTYILFYFSTPYVFDNLYGENTREKVIDEINASGTDEFALELMDWERSHFTSPYFKTEENWHRRFMLYKNKNGDLTIFGPGGPTSWTIYSGLANCYEYANVFVTLMEERGTEARLVEARGDDHVWAKYKRDGTWIAVDPSANRTVIRENLGERKDLSYVVSVDPETNEVVNQLTSRYVDTSNLTVKVTKDGEPISGVEIELQDPELMRETDRYDSPRDMVENNTGDSGRTPFVIGNGEYILKVKNHFGPLNHVYQKNITLQQDRNIEIDLSEKEMEWKLFDPVDSLT